jgi:hypothetical protein
MINFYSNLKIYSGTQVWLDNQSYVCFDPSWYLVSLDIKGSTKAIEAGKYKDVNMLGAASIVAFLNEIDTEIPFVFGGDGASILVPPSYYDKALDLMIQCQCLAHQRFNMELRADIILVQDILDAGYEVNVLKQRVDEYYAQAIFNGGGLSYAETLLKSKSTRPKDLSLNITLDLGGLECRWEDIKNELGYTLSILIDAKDNTIYKEVFRQIEIYFGKKTKRNPVNDSNLHLTFSLKKLAVEAKTKTSTKIEFVKRLTTMILENLLGKILIYFKVGSEKLSWGNYKELVSRTTDSEKFEDMMKLTLASSKDAYSGFNTYLENAHKRGELNYGVHVADAALMTCLVFERHGAQVHFVDASNGGYAMAAKALKAQIKE